VVSAVTLATPHSVTLSLIPVQTPKVLQFDSFFTETVDSDRVETERLRKCKLFYFLEDETLQVVEPPTPNSGLAQGRVPFSSLFSPNGPPVLDACHFRNAGPPPPRPVRGAPGRSRGARRPAPSDPPDPQGAPRHLLGPQSRYRRTPLSLLKRLLFYSFSPLSLSQGSELVLYGHRHTVTDADPFTRHFLAAQVGLTSARRLLPSSVTPFASLLGRARAPPGPPPGRPLRGAQKQGSRATRRLIAA